MGISTALGMSFCSSETNVDDVKMSGRKQNVAPMWKTLMKLVDIVLTNQHHFSTMCIWMHST